VPLIVGFWQNRKHKGVVKSILDDFKESRVNLRSRVELEKISKVGFSNSGI